MAIWDKVSKTNPKYTKQVNFGRKFTSINAQYQFMVATEQFGAFGKGWGVEDESFYMVTEGLLGYQAKMFWSDKDGKHSASINSSIATHNKGGKLDDDCFKKVSTDALTKGLSKLGFSADIFLGMYDDNKYVAQVTQEFSKDEKKPKLSDAQFKAMNKFIEDGKSDVVKNKLTNYELNAKQKEWFTKVFKVEKAIS